MSGLLPMDPAELDVAAVQRVRDAGFTAATLFLFTDHAAIDAATCDRIGRAFEAAGVDLVQLGAWMCPLLDPDPDRRAAARRQRHATLRVAGAVGARSIAVGPGTLSPRGGSGFDMIEAAWYPAAENHTPEAFDALVEELRADADVAAAAGVRIALECHQFTVLSTPERTRDVIDAVDSPWVRATLDPANWLTPLTCFDTTRYLEAMFDTLDGRFLDAHLKDLRLADAMHTHTADAPPGDGTIDFVTYLTRMQAAGPDAYAVIEHVDPADVARAREFVLAAAGAAGVTLD